MDAIALSCDVEDVVNCELERTDLPTTSPSDDAEAFEACEYLLAELRLLVHLAKGSKSTQLNKARMNYAGHRPRRQAADKWVRRVKETGGGSSGSRGDSGDSGRSGGSSGPATLPALGALGPTGGGGGKDRGVGGGNQQSQRRQHPHTHQRIRRDAHSERLGHRHLFICEAPMQLLLFLRL